MLPRLLYLSEDRPLRGCLGGVRRQVRRRDQAAGAGVGRRAGRRLPAQRPGGHGRDGRDGQHRSGLGRACHPSSAGAAPWTARPARAGGAVRRRRLPLRRPDYDRRGEIAKMVARAARAREVVHCRVLPGPAGTPGDAVPGRRSVGPAAEFECEQVPFDHPCGCCSPPAPPGCRRRSSTATAASSSSSSSSSTSTSTCAPATGRSSSPPPAG